MEQSISRVCKAVAWIVWFSLHLDCYRITVSLSDNFKCFPSVLTNCPRCRYLTPSLAPPHPQILVSSFFLSSSFPLLSFVLLSYAWIHMFLSGGQEILPVHSWCSVRTYAFGYVLLMYSWREMYSTSNTPSPSYQLKVYNENAAAASAKLLQSCLTLCDPIDGSPPGSPIPGILQARTMEWVAISFSNAWKWKWGRSVMSDSLLPHGLQPTRLLHLWDFPGKSTGVGCHCLLW